MFMSILETPPPASSEALLLGGSDPPRAGARSSPADSPPAPGGLSSAAAARRLTQGWPNAGETEDPFRVLRAGIAFSSHPLGFIPRGSMPVEKEARDGHSALLFAGTSVVSGMGQALVTATGSKTQFGVIARALVEKAPPTEYERGARSFGYVIMRTVLGLVFFVFLVNALLHRESLESLLFALALAVGLTPELLPMIMTVTLGQGAMRMAREKVIVKRLEAIENLGNMDILCSDKTGTLTLGAVNLQAHVDVAGGEAPEYVGGGC